MDHERVRRGIQRVQFKGNRNRIFSDYVERTATERGMKRGIEEGIKQGMEQGVLGAIRNLIKNTDMTLEQMMKVLEIPDVEKAVYVSQLNALERL